jgi:hypothetical protein
VKVALHALTAVPSLIAFGFILHMLNNAVALIGQ